MPGRVFRPLTTSSTEWLVETMRLFRRIPPILTQAKDSPTSNESLRVCRRCSTTSSLNGTVLTARPLSAAPGSTLVRLQDWWLTRTCSITNDTSAPEKSGFHPAPRSEVQENRFPTKLKLSLKEIFHSPSQKLHTKPHRISSMAKMS